MVIKSFKESHPLVLFIYFLLIIILSIIQRNYYIIALLTISTIIVDLL